MKRRALLASSLAAVGGAAVRARAGGASPDVFERFHRGLIQVHGELTSGARGIAEAIGDPASDAATDRAIASFTEELLNHHKSEDAFFFPAFRAAGRLRSSDVAFLARKDEEHVAIHRLCVELRDVGAAHQRKSVATRAWRATVTGHVAELAVRSQPHFAEEETTLTAAHVATLLSAAELVAVYRDMGENWHRR